MSTATIHKGRNGKTNGRARSFNTPLLLNGDHLSVPEFERRYEALPGDNKAELIEGIVFMSPPISSDHGKANSLLTLLLAQYAAATPKVTCAVNASVRLDGKNEYQPDVMLWIESGSLSRTKVGAAGLLEGRPELVAEISMSSRSFDLNEKKAVYQRNQIQEYIIWEMVDEPKFHWYSLENGEYVSLAMRHDPRGLVACSRVFPGLWIDWLSLIVGKGFDRGAFRNLNKGLKSAEHKAFVKKLAKS
jgi:Uma2 family endonuclease